MHFRCIYTLIFLPLPENVSRLKTWSFIESLLYNTSRLQVVINFLRLVSKKKVFFFLAVMQYKCLSDYKKESFVKILKVFSVSLY